MHWPKIEYSIDIDAMTYSAERKRYKNPQPETWTPHQAAGSLEFWQSFLSKFHLL